MPKEDTDTTPKVIFRSIIAIEQKKRRWSIRLIARAMMTSSLCSFRMFWSITDAADLQLEERHLDRGRSCFRLRVCSSCSHKINSNNQSEKSLQSKFNMKSSPVPIFLLATMASVVAKTNLRGQQANRNLGDAPTIGEFPHA